MEPTKVVGRRVAAFILDGLLLTAINLAVFFALATKEEDLVPLVANGEIAPDATLYGNITLGDQQWSVYGGDAALFFAITTIVGIGYWVVLQGTKGWTVGKLLFGIRLVKDDMTLPAGVGRTFLRQFLFIADAFPYVIPYLLGFIMAKTSDRGQRIGDRAASTLVVRKDAIAAPAAAASPGEAAAAFG